jgi:hypothetical protein
VLNISNKDKKEFNLKEIGSIEKFFLQYFNKENNSFRILLILEDESLLIIHNDKVIKREEALASIVNIQITDFPLEKSLENIEENFIERITNQFSVSYC